MSLFSDLGQIWKVNEIRLHRDALQRLLHSLQIDSRSEREIRIMIEAEASHAFMQHFYDLSYSTSPFKVPGN